MQTKTFEQLISNQRQRKQEMATTLVFVMFVQDSETFNRWPQWLSSGL